MANTLYEVYKGPNRSAFAVFTDLSLSKQEMILLANRGYFRDKLENLKCVSGYIKDDDLYLSSRYVEGTQVVWVVCRK